MKTLVLGGSTNPERYSFKAIKALQNRGLEAISIGRKEAELDGVPILTGKPILENIDTITIYMGAKHQLEYEDYLLALAPRRIIFNPGAENDSFMKKASKVGIITMEACTLVLLATGQY